MFALSSVHVVQLSLLWPSNCCVKPGYRVGEGGDIRIDGPDLLQGLQRDARHRDRLIDHSFHSSDACMADVD